MARSGFQSCPRPRAQLKFALWGTAAARFHGGSIRVDRDLAMSKGDKYVRLMEWSDEDQCFIGSSPELFYGGCHGLDAMAVLAELCEIIEDTIEVYEGKPLPKPLSGREFVNALQDAA
jgi:predicted RNase H-like HicB family nuclease